MDNLEPPEANCVRRADLRPQSPSSELSDADVLGSQLQEQLTRIYGTSCEHLDFEDSVSDIKNVLQSVEPIEDEGAEEYDFRLFAKPPEAAEPLVRGRIILKSPTPTSGDAGFVEARRPDAYYFTGQISEDLQEKYVQSTISGHYLLQGRDVVWPGYELPWRVISVRVMDPKKSTAVVTTLETISPHKKRSGKKRRIAIRKKTAGKAEKERLARMSQQEKEAADREKRMRRNREKKAKRRQKDKMKKLEATNEPG